MTPDHLSPAGLAASPPSYSHVVRARGDWTVYVAGQVALDADGSLVAEGDRLGQLERALANVETALAAARAGLADVVRLTIYVVGWDPALRPGLIERLHRTFGDRPLTKTLVGVQALALPGFLVEVDVVAVVD